MRVPAQCGQRYDGFAAEPKGEIKTAGEVDFSEKERLQAAVETTQSRISGRAGEISNCGRFVRIAHKRRLDYE